jgi:hypothetical protein
LRRFGFNVADSSATSPLSVDSPVSRPQIAIHLAARAYPYEPKNPAPTVTTAHGMIEFFARTIEKPLGG